MVSFHWGQPFVGLCFCPRDTPRCPIHSLWENNEFGWSLLASTSIHPSPAPFYKCFLTERQRDSEKIWVKGKSLSIICQREQSRPQDTFLPASTSSLQNWQNFSYLQTVGNRLHLLEFFMVVKLVIIIFKSLVWQKTALLPFNLFMFLKQNLDNCRFPVLFLSIQKNFL